MISGSALSVYATVRLRLAGLLENLLRFSQERKDEERSRFLRDLLSDLAEDTFRLAVFGKYNRGKSTLMNALLGMERLPTGVLPLTSVVTTVRHDSHEHVQILRKGSNLPQDIPLAQLPEYVTEEGNPGNEKKVALAQIFLPADILRYGFFLIDTPGVGSSITENTKAAEAFIARADAAIVVMSVESPLDEEELDLLRRVHDQVGKVFVVLNKADLISPTERERIHAAFTERVGSLIPGEVPTFILSARSCVAHLKESLDQRDVDLQRLVDALLEFISQEKTGHFLGRMGKRIEALLRDEASLDYLARRSSSDKNKLLSHLEQTAEWAIAEGKLVLEQLKRTAEECSDILQPHLLNWKLAIAASLASGNVSAVDPIQYLREQGVLVPSKLLLQYSATMDRLKQFVHQTDKVASPGLMIRNENDLRVGIAAGADELMGLPSFAWGAQERFWIRLGFGRIAALKRILLDPALEAYLLNIGFTIARDLAHRLALVTDEYERLIAGVVERNTRAITRPAKSSYAAAREHLAQELGEAMRLATEGFAQAPKSTKAPQVRVRSPQSICALCDHVTNVQFHFVRQYQYQLSIDPIERTNNAEHGGLCAFHTWLYESMSSPQGVCGGYSLVPLHWASTIESLQGNAGHTREHLDSLIKTILDGSQRCVVCELLRSAEADKLEEITESSEKVFDATLCLPHLCKAMSRENTASVAPLLLEEMASTLRRLGEDMQQFALKQGGLRYSWTSAGERAAHLNALRTIVGSRSLSYIKAIVEI